MNTEIKKGKLFIAEVTARLKGDADGVLAAKIARKAISAVDSQLAALRAKEVDLENQLEDANESLKNAKYPIEMITDGQSYIKGIQRAQESLDKAKDDLNDVIDSIQYFETLLASF
jgi:hypothetical protein